MSRFADLYLWGQAIKVLSFIASSFALVVAERMTRLMLTLLSLFVPAFVARAAVRHWRSALQAPPSLLRGKSASSAARPSEDELEREAELHYDAPELITARGYPFEHHYVDTPDGFLIGLHRIPRGREDQGGANGGAPRPVVFMQHGFMQSSEGWISARRNLPFMLADAGYDVWLGNARGNKYSAQHRRLRPESVEYWNFCIDDVAALDIPAALRYVTAHTGVASVAYVGFSMGTAVAFACFSTRADIARLCHSFVALAPATSAKGFSQPMLDSIAKMSPDFVFFLLGRRALFGSVFYFWQNLLTNAQLVRVIECCCRHLFGWSLARVAPEDRPVLFSHIYSMSSVKSVVHWFQIMRHRRFHMFQTWTSSRAAATEAMFSDSGEGEPGRDPGVEPSPSPSPSPSPEASPLLDAASSPSCSPTLARAAWPEEGWPTTANAQQKQQQHLHRAGLRAASRRVYQSRVCADYPLSQIRCPLHVLWGGSDHLPDTAWLLARLPPHATQRCLEGYEHLDFIYSRDALTQVYPDVIARINEDTKRAMAEAAVPDTRAVPAPVSIAGRAAASSAHELFSAAVLQRDGHRCVRCRAGTPIPLSAVALVSLALRPTDVQASFLRAGLLHGFETSNGLTLCASCASSFQRDEWGVDADDAHSIHYTASTQLTVGATSATLPLELTQPREPALRVHWPTAAILRERAALLAAQQAATSITSQH